MNLALLLLALVQQPSVPLSQITNQMSARALTLPFGDGMKWPWPETTKPPFRTLTIHADKNGKLSCSHNDGAGGPYHPCTYKELEAAMRFSLAL